MSYGNVLILHCLRYQIQIHSKIGGKGKLKREIVKDIEFYPMSPFMM